MFWAYVPIVKCLGIVAVKNHQHNKGSYNTDYTPGIIILEPHISKNKITENILESELHYWKVGIFEAMLNWLM